MIARSPTRRRRAGYVAALAIVILAGGLVGSTGLALAGSSSATPHSTPATAPSGASAASGAIGGAVVLQGQSSSVSATVPSSGTAPYSWQWLYSTDGGSSYTVATATECARPEGSGAAAGVEVTCTFETDGATPPGTYHFELRVSDSASVPESVVSPASTTVTVERAPGEGAGSPRFDTDPQEDCTGTCTEANWFGGTGGSGALVITTGSANELLVLEITDSGQTGAVLSTADISDSQGSTWTLESTHQWNGFGHDQYVYYALDGTAGSDTVTLDSAAGTHTDATTATAVLAAFSGVDTSAPIAAVGTFETGTGTQSSASVTTSVSPTTVLGVVSTTNGASAFTPTASPAFTQAGTINDGAATASFLEYYAASATGTYTSDPTWTGSVRWGAIAIAIQGASPLSVTLAPTSVVLDQGQSQTFTATGTGGTGALTYTWSISSGSCPGFSNSGTATLSYSPSGTTTNCVLTVTAKDAASHTAQPTTPASVTVNSQLLAPAAPGVSAAALDVNQAETVTGTIPTTGTATYAWTWLVSVNGGAYAAETHCATNSGTGAAAGATETCAIAASTLIAGDSYAFELQVTDSATTAVTVTSAASATVPVASALLPPSTPTVSATALDVNQALTVSGTLPSTGTDPLAWQWLTSVNGGAFAPSTQCGTNSGTGASAGAGETCSIAASSLTVGDTYAFELKATDSATTAESGTSSASSTVTVSSALAAPAAPTVSATVLDANQVLTVQGVLPTTGTSTYSWQWRVSVNGGAYGNSAVCTTNSGTGGTGGSTKTCTVNANTLTAGDSYAFQLQVSDSASTPETVTSGASSTVTVHSTLAVPATPSVTATALDVNQALTVTGTIPTTGSPTYAWQWEVSINGGAFSGSTVCGTNSGSGANTGATETCSVAANGLTAGDTYAFELEVTDSASTPELVTSAASSTVAVSSALTAPTTPSISAAALDVNQALTVSSTLASTGTSSFSWQWLVSVGGGAFVSATQCAANSGSGAGVGATESCLVAGGTLSAGSTYAFELKASDSATAPESQTSASSATVTVHSSLAAPAAPTASATAIDSDQTLTLTASIPSTGTPTYSWQWMVAVDLGAYSDASVCAVNSGSGAMSLATETCSIAAGALTAGDSYTFELEVSDSATVAESQTSPASAGVTVATALTAPAAPTVSATALDANQVLTVTATVPTTGTALYAWQWLVSVNGGGATDASECSVGSGTGASESSVETCTVSSGGLTAGDSYAFELQITDSATTPETKTSAASSTVAVRSALTAPSAPTVTGSALDVNQALTVGGTIPSSGTASYAWQWLVSVSGGAYGAATQCAVGSGTGAAAGAGVSCSVAGGTLTAGKFYAFELKVTDSASSVETATSPASPTVTVSTTLAVPATPTVSGTALDLNQALTVTGTIPNSGTAGYSWTWLVSVDSGSYGAATECATDGGSGASGGATETCAVASGGLVSGDSYSFELKVTDSATSPESTTSAASSSVAVSSTLTAPATPTLTSTKLDLNQVLLVGGTIPSSGTAPYAWSWWVSIGGAAYAAATECAANSGTGAAAGAGESCSIASGTLAAGQTYSFELKVTDSASSPESTTSAASSTVAVASALTSPAAPSASATKLDVDQALTISGMIPTTGTAPYGWQWLASVNGAAYGASTFCAVNSGTGDMAGAATTCAVSGGALTAGKTYAFELEVSDGATSPESATSSASATVQVSSALTAAAAPSTSASALDDNQALTVSATIPSTGTSPYAWQWEVSVDSGAYVPATECAVASGSGASAGAPEMCAIPAGAWSSGTTLAFELAVTDSATASESSTSVASGTVTVYAALGAPAAPSPNATTLDTSQVLAINGTIPSGGTAPYSWQWLVSVDGGAYSAATICGASASGSGATAGTLETCVVPSGTLAGGDTYTFELKVTDSASTPESQTSAASTVVAASSALSGGAPSPAGSVLDSGQSLILTAQPSGGSGGDTYQWYSGTSAAGCEALGTPISGATGSSFSAAPSTNTYYCYVVGDSNHDRAASSADLVTVNSALTSPGAPSPSAGALDVDQSLTVTATLASSGTAPYAWQWWISVDGAAYAVATVCGVPSGTGASGGATETCTVPADALIAGDSYTFEIGVNDSASTSETVVSAASSGVAVHSALTAASTPTAADLALDADQPETVTATIPNSGTAPYSWAWLVSADGGAFLAATVCGTNAGTGASAGATETCLVASGTLTAGDRYAFELQVSDSSGAGTETVTSAASAPISVSSALAAPAAPSVSLSTLSLADPLTVTGQLPTSGTATYSWQWWISANGGPYSLATACGASDRGNGGAAGTSVECAIASDTLAPGSTYTFELEVADSASVSEQATSAASAAVSVALPAIAVGTAQGPIGASYTVSGSGFGADSAVTVTFGSSAMAPISCSDGSFSGTQITTDSDGSFACSFAVPSEGPGAYPIVGTDLLSSSSTEAFTFTITVPTITVTPPQGRIGDMVTVNGTGFSVSASLSSLVFDSQTISSCLSGSLTTNSDGAFSCTFEVPTGVSGSMVRATDIGGATTTATFTAVAPSSPSSGFGDWDWALLAVIVAALVLLVVVGARRRRATPRPTPPEEPTASSGTGTGAAGPETGAPASEPRIGPFPSIAPEAAATYVPAAAVVEATALGATAANSESSPEPAAPVTSIDASQEPGSVSQPEPAGLAPTEAATTVGAEAFTAASVPSDDQIAFLAAASAGVAAVEGSSSDGAISEEAVPEPPLEDGGPGAGIDEPGMPEPAPAAGSETPPAPLEGETGGPSPPALDAAAEEMVAVAAPIAVAEEAARPADETPTIADAPTPESAPPTGSEPSPASTDGSAPESPNVAAPSSMTESGAGVEAVAVLAAGSLVAQAASEPAPEASPTDPLPTDPTPAVALDAVAAPATAPETLPETPDLAPETPALEGGVPPVDETPAAASLVLPAEVVPPPPTGVEATPPAKSPGFVASTPETEAAVIAGVVAAGVLAAELADKMGSPDTSLASDGIAEAPEEPPIFHAEPAAESEDGFATPARPTSPGESVPTVDGFPPEIVPPGTEAQPPTAPEPTLSAIAAEETRSQFETAPVESGPPSPIGSTEATPGATTGAGASGPAEEVAPFPIPPPEPEAVGESAPLDEDLAADTPLSPPNIETETVVEPPAPPSEVAGTGVPEVPTSPSMGTEISPAPPNERLAAGPLAAATLASAFLFPSDEDRVESSGSASLDGAAEEAPPTGEPSAPVVESFETPTSEPSAVSDDLPLSEAPAAPPVAPIEAPPTPDESLPEPTPTPAADVASGGATPEPTPVPSAQSPPAGEVRPSLVATESEMPPAPPDADETKAAIDSILWKLEYSSGHLLEPPPKKPAEAKTEKTDPGSGNTSSG